MKPGEKTRVGTSVRSQKACLGWGANARGSGRIRAEGWRGEAHGRALVGQDTEPEPVRDRLQSGLTERRGRGADKQQTLPI